MVLKKISVRWIPPLLSVVWTSGRMCPFISDNVGKTQKLFKIHCYRRWNSGYILWFSIQKRINDMLVTPRTSGKNPNTRNEKGYDHNIWNCEDILLIEFKMRHTTANRTHIILHNEEQYLWKTSWKIDKRYLNIPKAFIRK